MYEFWEIQNCCHHSMNSSARATIKKYRLLCLLVPEAEKCKIQVLTDSVPGESSPTPPFCVLIWGRESKQGLWCLFLQGHQSHHGDPTFMTSSTLTTSQRAHLPVPSHRGLGLQHTNSGGTQTLPHNTVFICCLFTFMLIYSVLEAVFFSLEICLHLRGHQMVVLSRGQFPA